MKNQSDVKGLPGTWNGVFWFEPQNSNPNDFFKLWGKVTTYKKTFLNYLLLILCFGWIWMAF